MTIETFFVVDGQVEYLELDESTGWYPNVWRCLEEYASASPEDRQVWEGEFLYWNSKVSADCFSLGKKYRDKFEELKR